MTNHHAEPGGEKHRDWIEDYDVKKKNNGGRNMKAYYKKDDVEKAYDEVKAMCYQNNIMCEDTLVVFRLLKEKFDALHTRMIDDTVRFDEIAQGNAFLYQDKTYIKIHAGILSTPLDDPYCGLLLHDGIISKRFHGDERVELLEMNVDFKKFYGA